ncbi:MAG: hypothetical protein ACE366_26490 [Bradymonadia bacterium]
MRHALLTLAHLTLASTLCLTACGGAEETTESAGEGPETAGPANGDVDGKADSYYACGFVDYPDEDKFAGHDITSKRTRALSDYANTLLACTQPDLDETFARRGINGEKVDSLYAIRVEGDDCFTSQSRWGWDDTIESDDDLEAMQRQVRSTVSFVKTLHEDLNGYPNRLFDTVVLCPNHIVDGPMKLEGRKLYVGVNRNDVFGWISPHNALDIRDDWSTGEHLAGQFGLLAKLWPVVDPAGTPRIALRHAIRSSAEYLAERLDNVGGATAGIARATLEGLIKNHVADGYRAEGADEEGPDFKTSALEQLETLGDEEVYALAEAWSGYIDDPDRWQGMDSAAAATHEAVARNAINLDIVQVGLFTFANFHDINVNADFFFPVSREYTRYIQLEEVDWDVKVRQYSLIGIWTSDNVNVNVAVKVERALETAGLEWAFSTLGR